MTRRDRGLVAAALLAVAGCGGGDAGRFAAQFDRVRVGDSDSIDCSQLPAVGDAEVRQLSAGGATHLRNVVLDRTRVTDAGIVSLSPSLRLETVSASETKLTDASMDHLAEIGTIERLRLDGARVTDYGLRSLGKLKSLRSLSLWRCAVTDRGLAHLKGLTKLESLSLDETAVTGPGVRQHLSGMPALRYLSVWKTKVGAADADDLRRRTPALRVNR